MRQLILRSLRKYARTALRMAAWNALFVISGLLMIALAGEVYFRLTKPFIESSVSLQFVDGVGFILKPHSQYSHWKWGADLLVTTPTNSLGFLDREPVSVERAAEGCHIAFIGDSFVAAREVPIADKFHVRLEEMATRDLPRLAIVTQAYGRSGAGQINQLPFYDEYARRLNPKLVVLVFYINDFADNSVALQSLLFGLDPDRMPFTTAHKDIRGNIELRPPDPEYERFLLPKLPTSWQESAWRRLVRVLHIAEWLDRRLIISKIDTSAVSSQYMSWMAMIAERPCCASLPDGWQPAIDLPSQLRHMPTEERLPPVMAEALEYTAFGIEQFKRRADRDGVKLAILAVTDAMGTRGDPQFDRLSAIAETYGIPIISQYDYTVSQGHDYQDGQLLGDDFHWNATGHQWAAEAVLEWLTENQEVCD